jgi:hypothetical protein
MNTFAAVAKRPASFARSSSRAHLTSKHAGRQLERRIQRRRALAGEVEASERRLLPGNSRLAEILGQNQSRRSQTYRKYGEIEPKIGKIRCNYGKAC